MNSARLRGQDGFIREILWLALILTILTVIVLDGLAIFSTHQAVHRDAATAAREARNVLAETQDLGAAKLAAQEYLSKSGKKFIAISSDVGFDQSTVITVEAQGHADTYAFKLLRYIGLKKWVNKVTNPTGASTSE